MANELQLPKFLVGRINVICRKLGKQPSQERLCVCTLNHPDIDDEQIAEMFGRNVRWVESVRARQHQIRQAEPFDAYLEYLDEGFLETDPTPFEIETRVQELKNLWIDGVQGNYLNGVMPFGRAAQRAEVNG